MLFDVEIYKDVEFVGQETLVGSFRGVDVQLSDGFGQVATAMRESEVVATLQTFDDNPACIKGDALKIGGCLKDEKEEDSGNIYGFWLLRSPVTTSATT